MLYLFILGRILMGGFFIRAGYNHFKNLNSFAGYATSKGVPMAREATIVTGIMLLLGGLGIVLGVYIELAVFLLAVFLIVTSFRMHAYWTVTDGMARMSENVQFYKNLGLLGGVLMLLAIPTPWVMSLF